MLITQSECICHSDVRIMLNARFKIQICAIIFNFGHPIYDSISANSVDCPFDRLIDKAFCLIPRSRISTSKVPTSEFANQRN